MTRRWTASLLLLLVAPAIRGAEAEPPRRWSLTPYLWLPTINSELRFELPPNEGGGTVDSEIGPSDYLTNLNGVLMLAAEMRHGRWAFTGDLIWLDPTADVSSVRAVDGSGGRVLVPRQTDLDTSTDLRGAAVTLAASWRWKEGEWGNVAVLGGVRYFTLEADLDWSLTTTITGPGFTFARQGTASGDTDLYDAIVGVRGEWRFGEGGHWYVPGYLDAGTGSSNLTWQAMAGIGYRWSRTSLLAVWRHLDYDQNEEDLVQEMRFDGPAVGFSWRF